MSESNGLLGTAVGLIGLGIALNLVKKAGIKSPSLKLKGSSGNWWK